MNTAHSLLFLVAVTSLVGFCASLGYAEQGQTGRLASDNLEERGRALEGITRERDQASVTILNELKRLAPGNKDRRFQRDDKVVVLITAAGVLRLSETVPFLAENIEMTLQRADEGTEEKKTVDSYYPALHALIEIGSPSIPFLLSIAEQETTDLRRRLAVVALVRILGNRSDYVAAILDALKKAAKDEVKSTNLQKALAVLDTDGFMTAP